jgi:Opioid growth factor receptor (OGFr) conserved region
MNFESQALQPHEITSMRSSAEIMERIIKSYEMMLDFYGMRLVSAETGLLDRSERFADRYDNLICAPGSDTY